MVACSQFFIRDIGNNNTVALFVFRVRRGRVYLSDFPDSSLSSGLGQVFGQGLMLHLNPFLVQLLDNLLCAETALLHSLQRWCQSKDRFLYGHGSIPVQRDGSGFESGKLLSDFLQLCCSDSYDGLPVFRRDHTPDGRCVFPVERDGRPRFLK